MTKLDIAIIIGTTILALLSLYYIGQSTNKEAGMIVGIAILIIEIELFIVVYRIWLRQIGAI